MVSPPLVRLTGSVWDAHANDIAKASALQQLGNPSSSFLSSVIATLPTLPNDLMFCKLKKSTDSGDFRTLDLSFSNQLVNVQGQAFCSTLLVGNSDVLWGKACVKNNTKHFRVFTEPNLCLRST